MKRNKFNLSYTKLLSCDMGELIPIGLLEVLPGDTIQQSTTCLVRAAPMLAPVMHPTHVQISHWFVPHRLVWNNWEKFITGGEDGMNASVFPTRTYGSPTAVGGLADYFGIPSGVSTLSGSVLPFRGYNLIWNEYFRDQDLQPKLTISLSDGADTTTSMALQNVNWEKDYFTTARPWEQKGPSITIPIGTSAPVVPDGTNMPTFKGTSNSAPRNLSTDAATSNARFSINSTTTEGMHWDDPNLIADLTNASAVSVNLLREALALQRFEEARARFGSRYVEYLRYLGVRSSDARLNRPEYLGGGRYPMQFSEVLQTGPGTDPVGDLKGHGIGVSRSNRYRRFFEEHGYVISLMAVKPKTIYMSGMHRTFNRRTKEDFFQKELQHIGQQEVLSKEIFAAADASGGNTVWGYQDRYDEYRRMESMVCGEFRNTLNFWHFGRSFATAPALNAAFVKCTPTENPFAVPSEDVLYVMCKHNIQARRILSKTGSSFIS